MKTKNKFISLGLSAALGAALLPLAGNAYTINPDSLVLGFRITTVGADDLNVQADLGPITAYTQYSGANAGTLTTFTVGNINNSLTQAYGSDWNERSDVKWGLIAGGGTYTIPGFGQHTSWLSKANEAGGDPVKYAAAASAFVFGLKSSTGGSGSAGILSGYGESLVQSMKDFGYGNPANYPALDEGVLIWNPTLPTNQWSDIIAKNPTYFSPNSTGNAHVRLNDFEQGVSFIDGETFYQVVDLWQLTLGSNDSSYIGSFGLTAGGDIIFSNQAGYFAAAVPEPATYVLVIGALALGFVACRRWKLNREAFAA
ncbi:PEP-CTERM sorting domain-containing protein [Opitutaceae bacterium TAV4]|nr:PEP-CTERM sorting domain-containing protein [Opitutaceae bacterium TAV4]RRK00927.1 PEP-CTERM sorting domain-containing protein [Opitutaceae bacterium TAV3]